MRRFLVDAQLPPALARWLATQGFEADHVNDRGLAAASDMAIWVIALDIGATIITKDKDFAQLRSISSHGPPVVWVKISNTRRAALLAWFGGVLPEVISALDRGETLIEVA